MDLSALFIWIYQRPVGELCRALVICTLVLLYVHRRMERRFWWHCGSAAALAAWFAVTLWATILSRTGSTNAEFQMIPFHSLRAVLSGGNPELLRSCLMNAVLFYPAGLLFALSLPGRWTSRRRLLVLAAVFASYSLAIELVQYRFGLGQGEIDDVLHNALGAMLGGLALSLEKQ